MSLRFSPYAWAKLLYLRDAGDTEVGMFGISHPEDLLHVIDVRTVLQECTCVTVKFDDDSVAEYFDQCVDEGRQPKEFGRIWIHTHPGHSPSPSRTDEDTFRDAFGSSDWSVMAILAKYGKTYARIQFNAGPGGAAEIDMHPDFTLPFGASNETEWEEEFYTNVHQPAPKFVLSTPTEAKALSAKGKKKRRKNRPDAKAIGEARAWAEYYDLGMAERDDEAILKEFYGVQDLHEDEVDDDLDFQFTHHPGFAFD